MRYKEKLLMQTGEVGTEAHCSGGSWEKLLHIQSWQECKQVLGGMGQCFVAFLSLYSAIQGEDT